MAICTWITFRVDHYYKILYKSTYLQTDLCQTTKVVQQMVNGSTEISNIQLINLNKTGCMFISKDLNNHINVRQMSFTAVKIRATMNHTDGLIWQEEIAGYFVVSSYLSAKFCRKLWKPYQGYLHLIRSQSGLLRKRSRHDTVVLCLSIITKTLPLKTRHT
jgi:hypothetical protein